MVTILSRSSVAAAVVLLTSAMLPSTADAHRSFLVPSSTVLSPGANQVVSVDAARGNDVFFFNHNAMPVDGLAITAPDGSPVRPAKLERFRYRTVFDVPLQQNGTWRIAVVDDGLRVQWESQGKPQRWNGPAADFERNVPAVADKLSVQAVIARVETFVTLGAPTPLKPTGRGLEATYETHPNDLVEGTAATIQFTQDGQPATGLKVLVVPGGARYRDQTRQQTLETNAEGRITVTWPAAGLYWLSAAKRSADAPAPAKQRTISYVATLEVLPK